MRLTNKKKEKELLHLKHLSRFTVAYFTYQKAVFEKHSGLLLQGILCTLFTLTPFFPGLPTLHSRFWRKLGVNTTEARGVRENPAGTLWVSFKLIVWLLCLMCSFETLTRPLRAGENWRGRGKESRTWLDAL